MNESVQKLAELIQDFKIAMFTTVDLDGSLYSRPMACQQQEFSGDLWFFSSRSSGKIRSIEADQHVNLAYAMPSDNRFISVSGRATIVTDHHKFEEFWNPLYKAWFPLGLEDPDLILIRVQVESAEYWDSPANTIVKLVGFAKAILTGQTARLGEHQKVNLPH
jgi:general stress protein 26